ncbi:AMP-binding protein [Alteromonas sp. a30]|uniref:AMP-binding protein n=1 Tax=Alteromonas sp. a30 TaxID=2730917 RepID=UPI0022824692|nr:AMP-binding protein [Alteromonas sp. a30]MCY7295548.1 AMP-binding protein [Alteromonas sp. a30]
MLDNSTAITHTKVVTPEGVNNLADLLEDSFQKFATLPAYTCLGTSLSYADIDKQSHSLACWLQHHSGLQAGDRVAIQLPNLLQYPIAAYAVLRADMVIVNTNPLYTPSEMQHQFKNAGVKAVIILDEHVSKLTQIIDDTDIDTVVVTHVGELLDDSKTAPKVAPINATSSSISFTQALLDGQGQTLAPRNAGMDDICLLQYTGGTTGVSKGAALDHRNMLSNAVQLIDRFGEHCQQGRETYICPLPLYHIYAFMVNVITEASMGNHTVLIPNPRDLDSFIVAMSNVKFTGFAGINTLFVGLCQHPEFPKLDFSHLKLTISGGSTLTSATAELWRKVTGCTISEAYGLSETSPVLTFNFPGKEEIGSVGFPLIGTEIQFWNDDDEAVADGEEGQLVARGPQVMRGYWKMPTETEKVLTADGWFKTGDIGKRLPSGAIKIVDRLKDMIIVSGFNVYPNQVEDVLTQHQHVLEAAVVGEQDDKTGERVCAYITVSQPISQEEMIAFCREQLTAYKVPKKVIILDELPKSTVGKILRRALRSE